MAKRNDRSWGVIQSDATTTCKINLLFKNFTEPVPEIAPDIIRSMYSFFPPNQNGGPEAAARSISEIQD
jgi:hypothetical protein